MNRSETVVSGIVLRNVAYGENDGILTVLSESGLISFKARGILKPSSKNAGSCLLYAESEFTLEETRSGNYVLTRGVLKKSHYKLYESIDFMCGLGLVAESLLSFLDDPSPLIYRSFRKLLEGIESGFDVFTLEAILLAKIMTESGYGLETSHCLRCGGTKQIVSLNYEEGGFICSKCKSEHEEADSPEYLKSIRYVFMVGEADYFHYELKRPICVRMIREFMRYFRDRFGYRKLVFFELFDRSY